ncbi:LysR family transcriptional regulator [Acuticoccus sediminis]|uniref:LysR family transcriptional regulator n=1 Tax=Acuticoccus sediminis TaxID=2184697 RepID=UPI001CFDBC84|nr:LysR family transcriptional regulator [Acuticoccus sediminis]
MANNHTSFDDLAVFLAVLQAGGFRDAARQIGASPSTVSETVSRLEARLAVRLLSRTTRSVAPTEAGRLLAARIAPLFAETNAAVEAAMSAAGDVRGTLRLNVPGAVMFDILPPIAERFLARYPDVRMEITVDDRFVDVLAAECDAGIRYGEALAQDMIAVPIGPRVQRSGTAASPRYLDARGRPGQPGDLFGHDCIRTRFQSGAMTTWEFACGEEELVLDPEARLVVGTGAPLAAVHAACAGLGIVYAFANWLEPHLAAGELEPVLPDWWPTFDGPRLYFSSRRFMPAPLRAFVDLVADMRSDAPKPP